MIIFYAVFTVIAGFDYYNSYQSPDYNAPSSPNDNVWKYTAETTVAAPTQKTEEWQKHVNSQGITSWDDHLRSQGIDPAVSFSFETPLPLTYKNRNFNQK